MDINKKIEYFLKEIGNKYSWRKWLEKVGKEEKGN